MFLERVEIVGFRGINRLPLMLEQNNILIGKNACGKSSLLDALTLLLSPHETLYHFLRQDFYFPPGDTLGREHHLHIILTFRETAPGHHSGRRYRELAALWRAESDGFHRIRYRLEGELARQCGHHFDAEGVKVIDFAQSRLRPPIKFARRMGIEWPVAGRIKTDWRFAGQQDYLNQYSIKLMLLGLLFIFIDTLFNSRFHQDIYDI